jgi:hypothetical protein
MEDDLYDVFRDVYPSLIWIGSTDSLHAARELIKVSAAGPNERFIIYAVVSHERFYLRAEDCSAKAQKP